MQHGKSPDGTATRRLLAIPRGGLSDHLRYSGWGTLHPGSRGGEPAGCLPVSDAGSAWSPLPGKPHAEPLNTRSIAPDHSQSFADNHDRRRSGILSRQSSQAGWLQSIAALRLRPKSAPSRPARYAFWSHQTTARVLPMIMIAVGREYFSDNQASHWRQGIAALRLRPKFDECQPAQYAFWSRQTTARVLPMIIRSNMSDQLRM